VGEVGGVGGVGEVEGWGETIAWVRPGVQLGEISITWAGP
jgi:hypothetical protein